MPGQFGRVCSKKNRLPTREKSYKETVEFRDEETQKLGGFIVCLMVSVKMKINPGRGIFQFP